MRVTEKAYAKLNITLDVTRKLPDGYHEMRMIMQSANLADDVTILCREGSGTISVKTNRAYLPRGTKNIAGKAAAAFLKAAGISGYDTIIDIKKRIPVCAGLGGGSADAAAVLRGMNRLFGKPFGRKELEELAFSLGADVPYCVAYGTSLAEGKGEVLTDIPDIPDCYILISKPTFSVSTPELFSRLDCTKIRLHPDTQGVIDAAKSGDITAISKRCYNVFEEVLTSGGKDIRDIKGVLYDNGALGAAMSGTGSAVFGIFDNYESANSARVILKGMYSETFLTKPTPRIEI